MRELLKQLQQYKAIDLAQTWQVGMPHWPSHPPFLYSLSKMHGESVLPGAPKTPRGVETEPDVRARRDFLRKIGYKR